MGKLIRIYSDTEEEYFNDKKFGFETNMVYDSKTRIIYYKYAERPYKFKESMTSYMSPYISENGKFCRFVDDQIVEID